MTDNAKTIETGIIVAVLERERTLIIPRLLDIKAKVDKGGTLDRYDLDFLGEVFAEAQEHLAKVDAHPELQQLAGQLAHLYHEITERGLANESAAGPV